jgi:hypothetical protein
VPAFLQFLCRNPPEALILSLQVVKVEPYALPAAHKTLMDLARSLNRHNGTSPAALSPF